MQKYSILDEAIFLIKLPCLDVIFYHKWNMMISLFTDRIRCTREDECFHRCLSTGGRGLPLEGGGLPLDVVMHCGGLGQSAWRGVLFFLWMEAVCLRRRSATF